MPEYRYLGRSGLKVSQARLGTDDVRRARPTSRLAPHHPQGARDQGFNFIDTADAYNAGRSEEIVGRAVKGNRDRFDHRHQVHQHGGQREGRQPERLIAQVDLRGGGEQPGAARYRLHRHPLLSTAASVRRAAGGGGARARRSHPPGQAALFRRCRISAAGASPRSRISPTSSASTGRSPASRSIISSTARSRRGSFRLRVLWARRRLLQPAGAGRAHREVRPDAAARRRFTRRPRRPALAGDRIPPGIAAHRAAASSSIWSNATSTPRAFAVGWVLNNRLITAAIAGPRTEEQWDDYVRALDYDFTAEDEALVNTPGGAGPDLDLRLSRPRPPDGRSCAPCRRAARARARCPQCGGQGWRRGLSAA